MTDLYAVIGHPVAHSQSPEIHARFARQTGQSIRYTRVLAPLDGFAATVRELIAQGFAGANVTVPFKLEAYALATRLTGRAEAAGAVNTLIFEDEQITGDNTDGIGLVTDLMHNADVLLQNQRILLLGAGGAARGVILPLLQTQPAQLVLANRTVSHAEQLVQTFAHLSDQSFMYANTWDQLQGTFDVVINATSASLQADVPPIAPRLFNATTFAYDMMYSQQPTAFMRFASAQGATVRDGLGMLVEQAAEAFRVWRGIYPETAAVYAALRAQL